MLNEYFHHFNSNVIDIQLPDDWKPFERPHHPDGSKWKYVKDWSNYKIELSDEIRINFYKQKTNFELPFHSDDGPRCALNFLIQGSSPIVFKDYGPVNYKFALLNVQKRHMVPADKEDRILLRYSFMSCEYEDVRRKLIDLLKVDTIKYKDLNNLLLKDF